MKQSQALGLLLFSTRGCANETLRERFARNDCKYFCPSTHLASKQDIVTEVHPEKMDLKSKLLSDFGQWYFPVQIKG